VKTLCVVDTCSLICLKETELSSRSLHSWLWDEFEVAYSSAVLDEINRHKNKLGGDASRRRWDRYIWRHPTVPTYERALFTQSFSRKLQAGICRTCRQPIWRDQSFTPDLTNPEDRGERHNCCVALDAVITGTYPQVIFLTDDFRAVRDYVAQVFSTFPLGQIWASLDFVVYLFVRHRHRIPLDDVIAALRNVNAQTPGDREATKLVRRLTNYQEKVYWIERVLAQVQGGR
jgi:hypothetical protein